MPTRPALAAAAAVMSFALTTSAPARASDALPTVDSVDFVRYAGTW